MILFLSRLRKASMTQEKFVPRNSTLFCSKTIYSEISSLVYLFSIAKAYGTLLYLKVSKILLSYSTSNCKICPLYKITKIAMLYLLYISAHLQYAITTLIVLFICKCTIRFLQSYSGKLSITFHMLSLEMFPHSCSYTGIQNSIVLRKNDQRRHQILNGRH